MTRSTAPSADVLARARALGRTAFRAGLPCTPALDPVLTVLLRTAIPPQVGTGAAAVMRAWQAGWIAAPMTDVDPDPAPREARR